MGENRETVARLSDEQWQVLKAALDGEIVDLQARLAEVTEELSTWHQEFTVTLDNGQPYQMDPLEAGKLVQDAEAEARMARQDLDAAIERGVRFAKWGLEMHMMWRLAQYDTEAVERRVGELKALILRIHKVCKHTLEGERSSDWYKMVVFDLGQLTTPADAQRKGADDG